jgi:uncharacterized phage protein (TIGR01671 family)
MMTPRFRVYDPKSKKMYYVPDGVLMLRFDYYEGGDKWDVIDCLDDNIIVDNTTGILMQSTGKFDKNGVEIYAGDVLRGLLHTTMGGSSDKTVERLSYIKRSDFTGALERFDYKRKAGYHSYRFPDNIEEDEVIGNIYEKGEENEQRKQESSRV